MARKPRAPRTDKPPRRVMLGFRSETALHERIQALANRADRTVSYVLHDLVVEALDRREREGQTSQPGSSSAA